MKKLLLLVMISVLFVGCNSMDGDLEVKHSVTLEKKSGFLGRKRELVTIEEGDYEAVLKPTSETNIDLVLKVDGKKSTIPFTITPEQVFPDHGSVAELIIHSADSGQPYDLVVKTDSNYENSREYSKTESCVLDYENVYRCYRVSGETECRNVPSPSNCSRDDDGVVTCSGSSTRRVCHTGPSTTECGYEREAVYGHKEASYVDRTTYKNVNAFLLEGSVKLATFKHSSSSTSSYYTGSTACY